MISLGSLHSKLFTALVHAPMCQRLVQEYRAKPTIKYGTWLSASLFVLYLALVIKDENELISTNLAQVDARLAKIEQIQAEHFWFDRLEAEQQNIASLENAIRRAETKSLAKAQMQATLTEFGNNVLQQSRVNVSDPVYFGRYFNREVHTVSAELRGRMIKGEVLTILDSLARSPYLQEIELLNLEFTQNRQVHIIIKAYFFIPE